MSRKKLIQATTQFIVLTVKNIREIATTYSSVSIQRTLEWYSILIYFM